MDKAIKNLDDIIKVQCMNGNYNYDPYMHGMANGLVSARAVITGEEPKYTLRRPKNGFVIDQALKL